MSEKIIGQITTIPSLKGNIQTNSSMQGKLGYGSYDLNKDYNRLANKPSIEGVELIDDKSIEDLGLLEISNVELKEMFDKIFN